MSLLLASLLLASTAAAAEPDDFSLFVQRFRGQGAAVWRVYADGRTGKLAGQFPESAGGSVWEGTTYPVPSPDRRRIAFLGGGQIRVRDLDSGAERAVTALEDPQSRFRLSITAWAPDSGSLLYHVSAPMPEKSGDDCGGPILSGEPIEYRVQNLETREDRRVSPPGRHAIVEWLPDGSFLLESISFPHSWAVWREGETSVRPLTKVAGQFGQFASDGGDRVMVLWKDHRESRIGWLRLSDGTFEPLSPLCPLAECNWGTFSPSGRRTAFAHTCRGHDGPDTERSQVIVDGRAMCSCTEMWDYAWIGDEALAVHCGNELIVVGVADGAVRSRTALPQ